MLQKKLAIKEEPKIDIGDIVKIANVIMTGKVTYTYINGIEKQVFVKWFSKINNTVIDTISYPESCFSYSYIEQCWYIRQET